MALQISHGGEGYVLLHESVLQGHSIYLRKSSKGVSGFAVPIWVRKKSDLKW